MTLIEALRSAISKAEQVFRATFMHENVIAAMFAEERATLEAAEASERKLTDPRES
jgi:hypothetical protein